MLFSCPHCGTQTDVEDRYAGQSGPCVTCGKFVTVPYAASLAASVARNPSRAQSRPSGFGAMVLVIASGVLAAVALMVLAFALVFPAVRDARRTAHRAASESNLAQIAQALRAYHDVYGAFPPPTIADETGKPMHSWRVLILPYLNHKWLYDQYRFDEPWDGPSNINILAQMPEVFRSPNDADADMLFETSYLLIVGPGTVFPTTSPKPVSDPVEETILVVERHKSGVAWMQPRDLDVTQMQFRINSGKQDIGSNHVGGAHVVMLNGQVHFLRDETPSESVHAMITTRGGETIPPDTFDQ